MKWLFRGQHIKQVLQYLFNVVCRGDDLPRTEASILLPACKRHKGELPPAVENTLVDPLAKILTARGATEQIFHRGCRKSRHTLQWGEVSALKHCHPHFSIRKKTKDFTDILKYLHCDTNSNVKLEGISTLLCQEEV